MERSTPTSYQSICWPIIPSCTPIPVLFSVSASLPCPHCLDPSVLFSRVWNAPKPCICPISPCAKHHGDKDNKNTIQHNPFPLEALRHIMEWSLDLFWLLLRERNHPHLQELCSSPVSSLSTSPHCVPGKKAHFQCPRSYTISFSSEKVRQLGSSAHRQLARQMKKFH